MRWESIVHTSEPGAIVLDTFPYISLKVVVFREDLERVILNFPLVYKCLVEGREIMYALRSQAIKPFFGFSS